MKLNAKLINTLIAVAVLFSIVSAQRPILDENGNPTGLINLNPDPNGEPWTVGKPPVITRAKRTMLDAVPELPFIRGRQLPEEVILMEDEEFPPVLNQIGGSCAQASGVSYLYSYQVNVMNGVAGTYDNQRAYGFTHNFLNSGDNSNGSWYWDGWEILEKSGCPTKVTFHNSLNGGLSGTRWMDGYDRWHTANDNRVAEMVKITINSMDDIERMKSWFHDLNGDDPLEKGGCLVFSANASSASANTTVSSGKHAGEPMSTNLTGSNMNHAMTFVGYSDEVGGVLLLNSWGTGFGNKGTVWIPYTTLINGGLYKQEVWGVKVKKNERKLEYKVKIDNTRRNGLEITTGFSSNISASTPTVTSDLGGAFDNCGGSYNMGGSGGASEIEIGIDVSEYYDQITSGDAKFFLTVNASSGTISDFTLLDYTQGATPIEFACDETSKSISGSTTLSIVMTSSPMVKVSSPNGGEEIEQYTNTGISWSDNIDEPVKIELLKAGSVTEVLAASTESDGYFEWSVPEDLTIADDYSIRITSTTDASLTDESDAEFSVVEEFIITQFPHTENFENFPLGQDLANKWLQLEDDDIDWLVIDSATPSKTGISPNVTGPDGDHTSGSGKYIYLEASDPNNPAKAANFISPKFDLSSRAAAELTFFYHMFSDSGHMGSLSLDVFSGGQWNNDVLVLNDVDYGDEWHEQKVDLSSYIDKRVQLRFKAEIGESWASDICIDDIVIDFPTPVNKLLSLNPSVHDIAISNNIVHFQIPESADNLKTTIKLYNVQGQLVTTLANKNMKAGRYSLSLGSSASSTGNGFYLIKMTSGNFKKCVKYIRK